MKALAIFLALFFSLNAGGHEQEQEQEEPSLRLETVPSFHVMASISHPVSVDLTIGTLEAPFVAELQKLGKKIDKNNYSNVIWVQSEIEYRWVNGQTIFAVNVTFRYTEPCTTARLDRQATCVLWEYDVPLKIVESSDAALELVAQAAVTGAKRFADTFRQR